MRMLCPAALTVLVTSVLLSQLGGCGGPQEPAPGAHLAVPFDGEPGLGFEMQERVLEDARSATACEELEGLRPLRWRGRDQCGGERLYEALGCGRSTLLVCIVMIDGCTIDACPMSRVCEVAESEDAPVSFDVHCPRG